jgi:membrane protein involved in colicin uptake
MTGLDPVRARRLDEARRQAERTIAQAREESSRLRAAAESEAASLMATAREEGDAAADSDTVRDWTAARRRARAIVLAAQKAAYQGLVDEAAAAARSDMRFGDLLERLQDDVMRALGPGARIATSGDEVIGVRLAREVRWSLREAVETLIGGGSVDYEALWR